MDAEALYQRVTRVLLLAIKEESDQVWQLMQSLVLANTSFERRRGVFSGIAQLRRGTGNLGRALIKGKPGNIFNVNISLTETVIDYAIDPNVVRYAPIHEDGGTIQITPKMRKFFWAMFAKTGDEGWKWMALTKKTVITIPARPYMAPARQALEQQEIPAMLQRIMSRVEMAFL